MAAGVANATRELLNRWNNDGRSQCLHQFKELCAEPGRISDLRVGFQVLVNSLVSKDGFRLLPEDFGQFYRELAQAQPTSSRGDNNEVISQILLDAISVADDTLDDLAQARETEKERQENRNKHRQIPERQPIVKLLRYLLSTGTIPHQLLALNLEYGILQDIGLIGNALQTSKQEVRARTRLIYRQTKVNLLREQSEGYSKFTVELCTSLGPPQDPHAQPDEAALKAQTKPILEKLMRIAGYFDLDPTRMLDLILDVFSTHVMTHYDLFLHIIKEFSGTRTRLLGSAPDGDSAMDVSEPSENPLERRLQEAEGPVTTSRTLPQLKNPLAQLLGFKLSHYAANEQSVPQELMFVTALLIREGHLSIGDIYNHLSPDEAGMTSLAEKQDAEMKKRIRIVKTTAADKDNALANAGVLSNLDDRDYLSRRQPQIHTSGQAQVVKTVKDAKMPEDVTQHRDLVVALLSVGALRPALVVLTKHPWLTCRYPQIADIMLKHLEHSIEPIYRSLSPATSHPEAAATYVLPRNPTHVVQNRKTKLTMTFPEPPPSLDTQQIFFYPRWTEKIPSSTTRSDLQVVVEPLLCIIGVQAHRSIRLFIMLCRIAREQFKDEVGAPMEDDFWTYMLRRHFLPLVSMAKDNPMLGNEIWPILQRLEIQQRWAIYAEWFQKTYEGSLEMRLKKAYVTRETKGVLRRLSSKNQGQSARALAKIAHHNPCVLFRIAIDQVMSYDNLADPLIEAFRTLSPIGYDILTYSLLDAFSQTERPRLKDDGTNISHWLQSLASLTAHLCRRYNAIDTTPILQFIVHRLQAESPIDSIILRELISKMGNIEPPQLLAENQIVAMGGGPVLQIATVALESRGIGQTRAMQKSSDKLLSAMAKDELILPLLLLLAQQSQSSVFKMDSSEAGLKGIGAMFDDLRGDFSQFISFLSPVSLSQKLSANEARDAFFNSLPSLATLVNDYGIEATTVMFICRAAIQRTIVEQVMTSSAERKSKALASAKEESMVDQEALSQPNASSKTDPVEGDAVMQVDSKEANPWLSVLQPWIDSVAEILPSRVREVMGAAFFVTFWQLSQFEITPLVSYYKEQRNKLSKMAEEHARRDPGKDGSMRERMNWQDKKDRIETFRDNLVRESNEHLEVYAATKKRLSQERKYWFVNNTRGKPELLDYIVQYCIFPRSLLSPMDAEFSASFIKLLHNLGTTGFWTLGCYRKCVGEQLRGIIFSCTQNEARNFGRFLRIVFSDLGIWFKDEKAFAADSKKGDADAPGFSAKASTAEIWSWTDFKRFLKKLHMQLGSVIVACITMTNREFMHVSNAILVLKELLPVFPTNAVHAGVGSFVDNAIKDLLDSEKRGDIKVLASSYQGQLRRIKSRWETPDPSSIADSKSSPQVNGSTQHTASVKTQSSAPSADARPSVGQNGPIAHPLPANPMAQVPDQPSTEVKLPKRPDIVKRIVREDGPASTDESHSAPQGEAADKTAPAVRILEGTDSTTRGSPRPPNGPVGHRDIPSGPRGTRGHRLTEDPSSRPPPSASMAPPKAPSNTQSSQDARASASQQTDRSRPPSDGDKDLGASDRRPPADSRRPDGPLRGEGRRRSLSPGRSSTDDARRRDEERRKDEKRSDRRQDDRGDRDRRGDREHRDRRESSRLPRGDDASSPHRDDSRKRTRDLVEKDPSERDSKRANRERERRDRHRDDRDDRRHDKDKHRDKDKDRGRDSKQKHGNSPTGASPKDPEREGARSSAPTAPRSSVISEEAKRSIVIAATEPPRRDRDKNERNDSFNRPLGGLSGIGGSRGPINSQRREERGQDNLQLSSHNRSLVSRLESPRVESSVPTRPGGDYLRDGGPGSDRETGRKRGPIEDNSGPAKRQRREGP